MKKQPDIDLAGLSLGNRVKLGTNLFRGLCPEEEISLILIEKHNEEFIFDVIYHDLILCQVTAKKADKGVVWEAWD